MVERVRPVLNADEQFSSPSAAKKTADIQSITDKLWDYQNNIRSNKTIWPKINTYQLAAERFWVKWLYRTYQGRADTVNK
jgi:hypothetical protein